MRWDESDGLRVDSKENSSDGWEEWMNFDLEAISWAAIDEEEERSESGVMKDDREE